MLGGGGDFGVGSIDVSKLPVDAQGNPVFPHDYVNVNTIFDVAKSAGLYTAYSEKHSGAYDILNAKSGNAVDDYYSPEIAAKVAIEDGKLVDASTAKNPSKLNFKGVTSSVTTTKLYDDLKVNAVLNEINGLNSLGTTSAAVPAIFGMNFQALSVAQKDKNGGIALDGTPSAELEDALKHSDESVGKILDALKQKVLLDSTLVVVTAKHGQNPRLGSATLLKDNIYTGALESVGIKVTQATQDDVALIWLDNQEQASDASQVLDIVKKVNPNSGIDEVYAGDELEKIGFGNPSDGRTPDLVVKLKPGYVLVGNPATSTKRAEHGGFSEDDTHVALVVGGDVPISVQGTKQTDRVNTTQIAVTALQSLGLNPDDLQGAVAEHTQELPGLLAA